MIENGMLKALTAFFAPDEHEFHRGYVYLREDSIAARLDEIDPTWQWILLSDPVIRDYDKGTYVSIRGRLIVGGVQRDGVGMASVLLNDAKTKEVNEAEKSAATDAFKRAARMFGIGRYLLNTPDNVRDPASLAQWLKRGQQPTPQQPQPQRQQPAPALSTNGDTIQFTAVRCDEAKSSRGTPFWRFAADDNRNAITWNAPDFNALGAGPWTITAVKEVKGDKTYYTITDIEPAGATVPF